MFKDFGSAGGEILVKLYYKDWFCWRKMKITTQKIAKSDKKIYDIFIFIYNKTLILHVFVFPFRPKCWNDNPITLEIVQSSLNQLFQTFSELSVKMMWSSTNDVMTLYRKIEKLKKVCVTLDYRDCFWQRILEAWIEKIK